MRLPDDVKDVHLLGDIHGDYGRHDRVAKKHHYTIQLGDFGFKYDSLRKHDPSYHKVLGGNHDNYDLIGNMPHYLGDFGTFELSSPEFTYSVIKVFYIRGADSIDKQLRTIGVDWWQDEQLTMARMNEALDLYGSYRPDVLLSHSPPSFAIEWFCVPRLPFALTEYCLDVMHEVYAPKLHIFGHMHKTKVKKFGSTKFVCVDINQTISLVKSFRG